LVLGSGGSRRRIRISSDCFVEYEWGGYTSLVVFLAMYFITLWVAWRIAVRMTTPKLNQVL
jgi:hypothetical protein